MSLSKFGGVFNAFNYAFGVNSQVPAMQVINGPSSGTSSGTLTLAFGRVFSADGFAIDLAAGYPLSVGANKSLETFTPTAVSNPTPNIYGTCTVTGSFANGHGMGDQLYSGDGGLGEAALVAASAQAAGGNGLVAVDARWAQAVGATLSHAGMNTAITAQKSVNANVTVLDWSGFTGALSYNAASGSVYASTGHVLY